MFAVWDQYWKPSHRHIKNKNRGSRILPCGTQHFTKPGSSITFPFLIVRVFYTHN